jgi:hypothetical protein
VKFVAKIAKTLAAQFIEQTRPFIAYNCSELVGHNTARLTLHPFQQALQRKESRDVCNIILLLIKD